MTRHGDKIHGGYIVLARRLFQSEMMEKPPLYFKLWAWMLDRASWKDQDKLKRGQLVTSIAEMQEAMSYRVGYRKVTPTKSEIRNSYEAFARSTMISTAKTTRGMVITILNYELYQNPKSYESHNAQHDENLPKRTVATHDREEGEEGRRKKEMNPLPLSDHRMILNDGSEYAVPLPLLEEWKQLFPNVDVPQQLRNMAAWCSAQPSRRKTKGGVKRFIVSWLMKEQDKGKVSPLFPPPPNPTLFDPPKTAEQIEEDFTEELRRKGVL